MFVITVKFVIHEKDTEKFKSKDPTTSQRLS